MTVQGPSGQNMQEGSQYGSIDGSIPNINHEVVNTESKAYLNTCCGGNFCYPCTMTVRENSTYSKFTFLTPDQYKIGCMATSASLNYCALTTAIVFALVIVSIPIAIHTLAAFFFPISNYIRMTIIVGSVCCVIPICQTAKNCYHYLVKDPHSQRHRGICIKV